jgi:hypothetical protein
MKTDPHAQARQWTLQKRAEGLTREEERLLAAHLAECEPCAQEEAGLSGALSALRSMHIDLPRNLASRTQMRVRMRAEELREQGPANRLIWAVAAVSWIFGLATAPFVWRAFQWLGQETGAPKLLLQFGFVLWWGMPALLAAGVILWEREWRTRGAE